MSGPKKRCVKKKKGQDHLVHEVWKSYEPITQFVSQWLCGYILSIILKVTRSSTWAYRWTIFFQPLAVTASRLHVRFHAHLVSICEASNGDRHHTSLSMLTNPPMDPNDAGKWEGKVPGMARQTSTKTPRKDYEWMLKNMCLHKKKQFCRLFWPTICGFWLGCLKEKISTMKTIIYFIQYHSVDIKFFR